jgi:hypothetical protein
MKSKKIIREQIFTIIRTQIESNDPPETKKTFDRLKEIGYSDRDTEMLIAQCVAVELFDVLKNNKPFDNSIYISNLAKLPEEPFD